MCSDHFVDGKPTVTHSFPELKLGYEKQIPGIAAETAQTTSPYRTPPHENQEQHPEFPSEHQYLFIYSFIYLFFIQSLQKNIQYNICLQ